MIGTIIALLISYWFYQRTEVLGKNPLFSAGAGFLAYYFLLFNV